MESLWTFAVAVLLFTGATIVFRHVWWLFTFQRRFDSWIEEALKGRFSCEIPRADSRIEISFDSTALTVTDLHSRSANCVRMHWAEVLRVTAFKRDLVSVDCICLSIVGEDGAGIELDEEMAGWLPLCEALPRLLPGCTPSHEWLPSIASPAFEPNVTELYSRTTPQRS